MSYIKFSNSQLDILKEICNIGAGHAATSLSMLLDRPIGMHVPNINIIQFKEIMKKFESDEDVYSVVLEVYGDIPGRILFIIKDKESAALVNSLLGNFNEISEDIIFSMFQEIGNILGNSYVNSIVSLLKLNLACSVPIVIKDMLAAVVSTCFIEINKDEENIVEIEANLFDEHSLGLEKITFFFIPEPNSIEILFSKSEELIR